MKKLLLASLATAEAFQATPPTFAQDFYTGLQSNIAIVQGGYTNDKGACCDATNSPGCKIQYISEGEDYREQGTKQRTRSDSPRVRAPRSRSLPMHYAHRSPRADACCRAPS